MSDTEVDELGPVDYVVVEFPADKADFSGEMATALSSLIDRDVVRVLDLILLNKELDGSVEGFESHDFGHGDLSGLGNTRVEHQRVNAPLLVDSGNRHQFAVGSAKPRLPSICCQQ